ncbi:MAG TPA: polysaccharide biosynthesis tyrosine autokinase [Candidatus Binatia bacterium]|nr:polysaccharide biosynthesis tyrosine autokinase [Candidatus Binatia bacterium]
MNEPVLPPLPPATDQAQVAALLRLLNRHKFEVVGLTLLFAIIGTVVAFSTEPTYDAAGTLLIEPQATRPVQVQEVYDPGYGTYEYYSTQSQLLRSRELVGRVVDQLALSTNTVLLPPPEGDDLALGPLHVRLHQWLPFLPEPDAPAPMSLPAEVLREAAINAVLRDLYVELVPRTQLVRVHFSSKSPDLAAQIVNAVSDRFVDNGLESRFDATERASRWLTERLGDLRNKLETSEAALQAYREKNQLVSIGGSRGLYEEEITDNARKLREAQRKKTELASSYWKIQQAGNDPARMQDISSLLLDPLVQKAANDVSDAQQAIIQLKERYGERHPAMVTAQARVDNAVRAYHHQLQLAANGVKAEYEIAAETERALLSVVQAGKERIRKLDEGEYQLRSLERETQTNRDLYALFLKRFKETDLTSSYQSINARIVDRAIVPAVPVKPNKPRLVVLWCGFGLLLSLALVTLRNLLSEVVRSVEQLEESTQLPVISVLPTVAGFGKKSSAVQLCLEQPRSQYPEGVRSIRASLYLNDVDKRMKRVLFTSAVPREGKSSLAASFATTMAQMESVVLVEADLRAPSQKRIFGIPKNVPGLVELLTGQVKLEQALFHHKDSGVHVLPVSELPINPAEVVASAAMTRLIDSLAARFDRVILDSPPCQVAADAQVLAHRADAVIFVIHGGATGLHVIQTAMKQLRAARAPLLGHVINQVDTRSSYGYEYQYYQYGNYPKQ